MVLIPLLFSLSTAFAAETPPADPTPPPKPTAEEVDFYAVTLAKWMTECKDHFDITPFVSIALGGDSDVPEDVASVERVRKFMGTGHLELPADRAADPIAQRCGTRAEGLMAGGIGHQFAESMIEAIGKAIGGALEAIVKALKGEAEAPAK